MCSPFGFCQLNGFINYKYLSFLLHQATPFVEWSEVDFFQYDSLSDIPDNNFIDIEGDIIGLGLSTLFVAFHNKAYYFLLLSSLARFWVYLVYLIIFLDWKCDPTLYKAKCNSSHLSSTFLIWRHVCYIAQFSLFKQVFTPSDWGIWFAPRVPECILNVWYVC